MSVYHNGQKVLNNITSVNEEAMKEIAKEVYSTDEKVVGTWIDGKPIYRKVITFTPRIIVGTSWQSIDVSIPDIDSIVKVFHIDKVENYSGAQIAIKTTSPLQCISMAGLTAVTYLILEYTKKN